MASQSYAREFPPSRPYVYMELMQATRQGYPEQYLQKHFPDAGKEKSKTCGNWKIILYKIKANGELVVAFEETNFKNIGKVGDAVKSFFVEDKKTLQSMEAKLDKWAQKYGNITTFIGFSHGGYFAVRAKKSWDVWRFTYNADQVKPRPKHIHFRSDKGITFLPNTRPENSIVIGEGSHSFNEGAKNVTPDKDWHDFDE